jgi:Kef-type K+ transport system membrane component KefB
VALGSLAAVGVLALVLTYAPRLVRGNQLGRILREGEGSTAQTTVRLTVLLLLLLLAVAEEFGLDVVLGAFLAGIVLRRWAPGDTHALEGKLDAIGYGFFIPLFFVASGMTLDVRSIAEAPLRLAAFFVLLLAVRGVPALFLYRRDLPAVRRVQLMLLTATALPLLVALSEIGLRNGTMLRENAAALVGAGALSVLVFPMAAVRSSAAAGPAPRRRPPRPARHEQPPTIFAGIPVNSATGQVREHRPAMRERGWRSRRARCRPGCTGAAGSPPPWPPWSSSGSSPWPAAGATPPSGSARSARSASPASARLPPTGR